MTMFHHSLLVLLVIVVAFAAGKKFSLTTELSMLAGAFSGLAAHMVLPKGADPRSPLLFSEAVRHIVEGTFTYFDVCLIFLYSHIFHDPLQGSGGVAFIVRKIVRTFHSRGLYAFFSWCWSCSPLEPSPGQEPRQC